MGKLGPNIFETTIVQAGEEFSLSADYVSRLSSTEEISAAAVKIFDKADVDKSGDILNGAATVVTGKATNSKIVFNVHALVAGERYNCQIIATTDATTPQKLEVDIYIPVKNIT